MWCDQFNLAQVTRKNRKKTGTPVPFNGFIGGDPFKFLDDPYLVENYLESLAYAVVKIAKFYDFMFLSISVW